MSGFASNVVFCASHMSLPLQTMAVDANEEVM
jgi:hypothetical protein